MDVIEYTDQMESEVIDLFIEEYGFNREKFAAHFKKQLCHPFQRDKAFKIVAIDEGVIKGFMSFIYWPIANGAGGMYNSYQCGNVIVGTKFRGQRVFGTMLKAVNENFPHFCYDFIIAFPVEASFPGFIRNGWTTPFQLDWYIKPHMPFRALFSRFLRNAKTLEKNLSDSYSEHSDKLTNNPQFIAYRQSIRQGQYFENVIENDTCTIRYSVKIQQRGRFLTEGIIGQIQLSNDSIIGKEHVHWILKDVRKHLNVSFLSLAIPSPAPIDAWTSGGFKRYRNRKIHFILKPGSIPQPERINALLRLGRADIDTW